MAEIPGSICEFFPLLNGSVEWGGGYIGTLKLKKKGVRNKFFSDGSNAIVKFFFPYRYLKCPENMRQIVFCVNLQNYTST